MANNKVVVKYQDGTIKKGETRDFLPNKDTFHLNQLNSEVAAIEMIESIRPLLVTDE